MTLGGIPFAKPLQEGLVLRRPNRFIAEVELNGVVEKCHCPVSGRIGGLTLDGARCLVSGPYEGRGTRYTVEALAFEEDTSPTFQWVGINQNRMNGQVDAALKANLLASMLPVLDPSLVKREQRLGQSVIDFRIGCDAWLEVKTPLLKVHVTAPGFPIKESPPSLPSERMVRQFADLTARTSATDRKMLLVNFQYRNTLGTPLAVQVDENIFRDQYRVTAAALGVEFWCAEWSITPTELTLAKVVRISD